MAEQHDKVDIPSPGAAALSEPRAHELLPPDCPAEEVEQRRIAERRVVGWDMCSRLHERRVRRPVGNSRAFWKRIEDDDPFLPSPGLPRAAQIGHDQVYPTERLERIPQAQRPPPAVRPGQAAAQGPPTRPQPRPQQPAKPAPQPRQPAPSQVHTPESRPVANPRPQPPADADRRLPPRAPNPEVPGRRAPTGRLRVNSARTAAPASPVDERSPAEIRAEKRETRLVGSSAPPPPKLRGIDDILGLLGELKLAEEMHKAGIVTDDPDATPAYRPPPPEREPPRPTPKPRAQAPRPPPEPARAPPQPPKPAPAPEPEPDRSPSGAGPASGGNLDDLFGGGQDTRVRIGRRSVPKGPKVEKE